MSINIKPDITTAVNDGHVYANVTYTADMLDEMAKEVGRRLDAELFARLAMERGYVPNDMFSDLRECIIDLWPRASLTMGDRARAEFAERLRALGVEVG